MNMSGFVCQECGHKFKTTRAAEWASQRGCPGCGGVDIDLALLPEIEACTELKPGGLQAGGTGIDSYKMG